MCGNKSRHRIKTDAKIRNKKADIFILDKSINNVALVELGHNSQDSLQMVETEKLWKYDLFSNHSGLIYKFTIKMHHYVINWYGILTKYYKYYIKKLRLPMNVEAYIQSTVHKNTVKTISYNQRRGHE